MDRGLPPMVNRFIQVQACIVAPGAIDEIVLPVRLRRPDQPWERVHDTAEVDLHLRAPITFNRDQLSPPKSSSTVSPLLEAGHPCRKGINWKKRFFPNGNTKVQ
jgi:hypothetical protein